MIYKDILVNLVTSELCKIRDDHLFAGLILCVNFMPIVGVTITPRLAGTGSVFHEDFIHHVGIRGDLDAGMGYAYYNNSLARDTIISMFSWRYRFI